MVESKLLGGAFLDDVQERGKVFCVQTGTDHDEALRFRGVQQGLQGHAVNRLEAGELGIGGLNNMPDVVFKHENGGMGEGKGFLENSLDERGNPALTGLQDDVSFS